MVPAITAAATSEVFRSPASEAQVAVATAHGQGAQVSRFADSDRITLSSNPTSELIPVGYDANGHVGGGDTGAPSSLVSRSDREGRVASAPRAVRPQQDATASPARVSDDESRGDLNPGVRAILSDVPQTTSTSLYETPAPASAVGMSRPQHVQIGAPPLLKALDLLRSMIMAVRDARPAVDTAAPAERAGASPKNGGMQIPPSDPAAA